MSPEPWKHMARPTHQIEWAYCLNCGKRYVVPVLTASKCEHGFRSGCCGRKLTDLEEIRGRKHVCRTPEQLQALRDYEEGEL